jgi:hypothetical protein
MLSFANKSFMLTVAILTAECHLAESHETIFACKDRSLTYEWSKQGAILFRLLT